MLNCLVPSLRQLSHTELILLPQNLLLFPSLLSVYLNLSQANNLDLVFDFSLSYPIIKLQVLLSYYFNVSQVCLLSSILPHHPRPPIQMMVIFSHFLLHHLIDSSLAFGFPLPNCFFRSFFCSSTFKRMLFDALRSTCPKYQLVPLAMTEIRDV